MVDALRRMVTANWLFCAIALGYAALVWTGLTALGIPFAAKVLPNLIVLTGCVLGLAALEAALVSRLVGGRRAHRGAPLLVLRRLVMALPALPCMAAFLAAFGDAKQAIPRLRPFYLDPFLWRADRMLFGGDPWRLLHPLIGYPVVTALLNFFYVCWLLVFFLLLAHSMIGASNNNRNRFALSFMLTWALLGNVAATALSSVGPCFFGYFYGYDPYRPLRAYLDGVAQQFPLSELQVQHMLLTASQTDSHTFGMGISAAPSIHVATAALIACYAWGRGRFARWCGLAFLLVIELGSIQLGYHYAVGGILGAAGAATIWWAVGQALAARGRWTFKAPTHAFVG